MTVTWLPLAAQPIPRDWAEPTDADLDAIERDWRNLARCAEVDPEAFFPEKGGSTAPAKKVCRMCEVRAECLNHALETHELFGVWGGMSDRERRRLLRDTTEGRAA